MVQSSLIDAYKLFMETARPFLLISNEDEYLAALETIELALESSEDTPDDPLKPLIAMLSDAIARYESQDVELMEFEVRSMSMSTHSAVLRTLMDQHKLTEKDLPEIGDETEVYRVLSGQHDLSQQSIEALSERFGLRPAIFVESGDRKGRQRIR